METRPTLASCLLRGLDPKPITVQDVIWSIEIVLLLIKLSRK